MAQSEKSNGTPVRRISATKASSRSAMASMAAGGLSRTSRRTSAAGPSPSAGSWRSAASAVIAVAVSQPTGRR